MSPSEDNAKKGFESTIDSTNLSKLVQIEN
jgi:hypothetical protein